VALQHPDKLMFGMSYMSFVVSGMQKAGVHPSIGTILAP
jgi:hypothetical protein